MNILDGYILEASYIFVMSFEFAVLLFAGAVYLCKFYPVFRGGCWQSVWKVAINEELHTATLHGSISVSISYKQSDFPLHGIDWNVDITSVTHGFLCTDKACHRRIHV